MFRILFTLVLLGPFNNNDSMTEHLLTITNSNSEPIFIKCFIWNSSVLFINYVFVIYTNTMFNVTQCPSEALLLLELLTESCKIIIMDAILSRQLLYL